MLSFVIKLAVAVLPLITLIAAANLSDPEFRKQLYDMCRRRRTRSAVARALASGILLR